MGRHSAYVYNVPFKAQGGRLPAAHGAGRLGASLAGGGGTRGVRTARLLA